jgi:branched-chain amino acid transport system substrate-binding protein
VSTKLGFKALVEVNFTKQNACQSLVDLGACSMHESCIHQYKDGLECTESGKKGSIPVRVGPAQSLLQFMNDKHMQSNTSMPIKIGVLYSTSGVTSLVERTQLQATQLAVEEINAKGGVIGREIELICLDPACTPSNYPGMAEMLIREHGVRLIMGCYMSSTRKAVIPIVERQNALLFYATPYEGFEYSRNVFYAGAAPNQNILPLASYMLSHHGMRVALVGSDFVCPYESNRIMNELIQERGGEKANETYLPLNATLTDFRSVANRLIALSPDFIFSTVVGAGNSHLHRALADAGLNPFKTPVASHMSSETEIADIGADLAEGLITCAGYFESLPTAENQRVLALHKARFGDSGHTNVGWEAAYFQMHLLAKAISICESDDPTLLAHVLPGLEFDAPQGLVKIDEQNNHTYLNPRIGRCNSNGQFDVLASASELVRADPFVIAHTSPLWTADKDSNLGGLLPGVTP